MFLLEATAAATGGLRGGGDGVTRARTDMTAMFAI